MTGTDKYVQMKYTQADKYTQAWKALHSAEHL